MVRVRGWSDDCQVNVKSQSELDIGGREPCSIVRDSRLFDFMAMVCFNFAANLSIIPSVVLFIFLTEENLEC